MPPRPSLTTELISALAKAVPRRAFEVWFYLYSRARRDTSEAWPSMGTIGKALDIRRDDVPREIRRLESAGWLTVQRGAGTNRYTLHAPQTVAPAEPTPTPQKSAPAEPTPCPRGANTLAPAEPTPSEPNQEPNQEPKKKARRKTKIDEDLSDLDLPFGSDRFLKTWADFQAHRVTIGPPLTKLAGTRILAKCQAWGEPVAIEALDTSIENGWKGIFQPKSNGRPKPVEPPLAPWVDKASNYTD